MASYLDQLKTNLKESIDQHIYECPKSEDVEIGRWKRRTMKNSPIIGEYQELIILEMAGETVLNTIFVTDSTAPIPALHKKCERLHLIFVNMAPLTIAPPLQVTDCVLNDSQKIDVSFHLRCQVHDAKQLWQGTRDPYLSLREQIVECTKHFFFSITSDYLLVSPAELMQERLYPTRNYRLKEIKEDLEDEVKQIQVAGLTLLQVRADLILPEPLTTHLKQRYEKLYSTNDSIKNIADKNIKFAERQRINAMMADDTTFAPYKLRDVILALDNRLLENFYTSEWSVAMKEVQNLFWQKKNEYLRGVDDDERMRQFAKLSESMGMKHEVQPKLQVMMNKRLTERERSIHDFLHSLVGMSSNEMK